MPTLPSSTVFGDNENSAALPDSIHDDMFLRNPGSLGSNRPINTKIRIKKEVAESSSNLLKSQKFGLHNRVGLTKSDLESENLIVIDSSKYKF